MTNPNQKRNKTLEVHSPYDSKLICSQPLQNAAESVKILT